MVIRRRTFRRTVAARSATCNVSFGRQHVLRDINLTIPRGQTLAIIGESGCGKTVLLKTIIGLMRPTSGTVLFDGHDLATLSRTGTDAAADAVRLRVPEGGAVRQHDHRPERGLSAPAAFPTVRRGNRAPCACRDWPRSACRERRWQEAGRTLGRHAEAGRPGAGPGARSRNDALRRADDRPGPDHERRDQRVDHPHAAAASGDEHRGDARHADGAEGGRPRGDAVSAGAAGAGRAADHLRRPAQRTRPDAATAA